MTDENEGYQRPDEEAWYDSQKRKDQARQFNDAWRRECEEWFDAFDKRMQEILNDRR